MQITESQLLENIEVLRHGGPDAVVLFVDLAKKLFDDGGEDQLRNWIGVAAPAMPEMDRNAAITILMRALFGGAQILIEERVTFH